jgi:serine/threonine protein kinase
MASRADLELAKKLLGGGVLGEPELREALEIQQAYLEKGKSVTLERVLVAKGRLPAWAPKVLNGKSPLETQPFASYRLDRVLGEGGSSIVYGGTYVPNGASVAVKVLDPVHGLRPELVARFEEEARLLIELEHENVVTGYEVGVADGLRFFSMDWIQGPTVLQMIDRAGRVENQTALWITIQMAKALAYLHARGLLHRDIKPGNVMIDASGRARLIDLGLVRHLDAKPADGKPPTEEITTVGTVEYISPEQARGRGDLDVRTDVYSLGVTLYHMVVGDVPFHGETDYEVMAKHILSSLDSQKVKQRRIDPAVHYAITKMMSKEREHRYGNADEVVKDLSRFLPQGGPPPIVLPVETPATTVPGALPPLSPPVLPRRAAVRPDRGGGTREGGDASGARGSDGPRRRPR